MKKMIHKPIPGWRLTTFITAMLNLFFTLDGFAQVLSLPQNSNIYSPNAAGTGWVLTARGTYTYDSLGREIATTRTALSSQQVTSRDSIRYDAAGNVIYLVTYFWNGNAWNLIVGRRTQLVYNAAGKKTEETTQSWTAGAWKNDSRRVTTYNTANYPEIITNYHWQNNAWEPAFRFVYSYSSANNPPTEQVYQQYLNGSWENIGKMASLVWHNFNDHALTSFSSYYWSNNAWHPSANSSTVYDAFGGYVKTDLSWNNGTWDPSSRQSVYYDSKLNYTGQKSEQFLNNGWVTHSELAYLLTYNAADQITERIYRSWDPNSSSLKDREKTVYANFLLLSAGQGSLVAAGKELTVYPNPATDLLFIQKAGNEPAAATLTDLSGRVVLRRQFPASARQQLDLSNLANGTYLLQLETKSGLYIRKVVKR